jgi:predicted signal transduction protein with EAL and GGDEF domain
MGHALGKIVIAEGIETLGQSLLLRELGCDMGQGFQFSRPVPAEAFGALLAGGPLFAISPLPSRERTHGGRRRSSSGPRAGSAESLALKVASLAPTTAATPRPPS